MGRVGLGVVLALVTSTAGLLTTSSATASTTETRATTIVASYPRLNGLAVSLRPSARLTDAVTGQPLAGQQIDFFIGVDIFPSCTAVTDANGVAKCTGTRLQVSVLLARTYEAVFGSATVGDIYYELSRNRATLLRA
jgi:hypothetical protein